MAMMEIEKMLKATDTLDTVEKKDMCENIKIACACLTSAYERRIMSSEKMLELHIDSISGLSNEEMSRRTSEIFGYMEEAEYDETIGAAALAEQAEILNVPNPIKEGQSPADFAKELVSEYGSFATAFRDAFQKSVSKNVPFILNEHPIDSAELMALAEGSVAETRKALEEHKLLDDPLKAEKKIKTISTGEYIVKRTFTASDFHDWMGQTENVTAMVDIIRNDTKEKDTVEVPAIYIPEKNVYLISSEDYDKNVRNVGIPIAHVDVNIPDKPHVPGGPGPGGSDFSNLRDSSVAALYGYRASQPKAVRQKLLKTLMDTGVFDKERQKVWIAFRARTAQPVRSFGHAHYPALLQDKMFIESYTPQPSKKTYAQDISYLQESKQNAQKRQAKKKQSKNSEKKISSPGKTIIDIINSAKEKRDADAQQHPALSDPGNNGPGGDGPGE